jgi:hypothetical protein
MFDGITMIEHFERAAKVINVEFQRVVADFLAILIKADPSIKILEINVLGSAFLIDTSSTGRSIESLDRSRDCSSN